MFSKFTARFSSINIKNLNLAACGIITFQYLMDKYALHYYFSTILTNAPLPANSHRYNASYELRYKGINVAMYPKGGPGAVAQAMDDYFVLRTFYPGALIMQAFSLAMINHYNLRKGRYPWIPCCLLLGGNLVLTFTSYLSGVRFLVLMKYIENGDWKVYENFAELRTSQKLGEYDGIEKYLIQSSITACALGSVLASPIWGSITVACIGVLAYLGHL
ncbi:unnamed protein product [Blepharisma stoltei]|uniref:Uncharacterized protein n=1 Tax=Blepharisma stoltei TaxID=1481888 RepID=A0AAU9K3W5_9CILI|nr:unnamed protein product [Blepharisma stoltei]